MNDTHFQAMVHTFALLGGGTIFIVHISGMLAIRVVYLMDFAVSHLRILVVGAVITASASVVCGIHQNVVQDYNSLL